MTRVQIKEHWHGLAGVEGEATKLVHGVENLSVELLPGKRPIARRDSIDFINICSSTLILSFPPCPRSYPTKLPEPSDSIEVFPATFYRSNLFCPCSVAN